MPSRSWLLVSIPVAMAAAGLLAATVRHLVRTVRRSVVLSVPALARQRVAFAEAGDFVLNVEAPHGARVLSGAGPWGGPRFSLAAEGGDGTVPGSPVPVRAALGRTTVSGMSRVRRSWAEFTLPAPGSYVLGFEDPAADRDGRGDGRGAGRDRVALVVTRPIGLAIVGHVLALLVLGGALVGALVTSGLVVAGGGVGGTT